MSGLSYAMANIWGILFLTVMLVSLRRKEGDTFLSDQRVFKWMLITNILILVLDSLTGFLDGQPGIPAYWLNHIITAAYYITNPVMSLLFALYCDLKLKTSQQVIARHFIWYMLPVTANAILSLINLWYPVYFSLNAENVYTRGPYFALSLVLSYCLVFYGFVMVLFAIGRERKNGRTRELVPLLLFPLSPMVGGIIQIFLPGISIVWVSTVLSLMVIFNYIQNGMITTDPLTGLFNRAQLAPCIQWKVPRVKAGGDLYLLMLDLDDFKRINDRFGHLVGNEALRQAGEVLRACAERNDVCFRYGGDEFVVVAERRSPESIPELIARIRRTCQEVSERESVPYILSFSIGVAAWKDTGSMQKLVHDADMEMYREKVGKKVAALSAAGE